MLGRYEGRNVTPPFGGRTSEKSFEDMKKVSIHEICISLNGPTDEINAMSERQGFDLAIKGWNY